VGKGAEMTKRTFADIIGEFIGQPFRAGGCGQGGYGCLDACHAIARALGKNVPDEFRGYDLASYVELYQTDRKKANEMLLELLDHIGREIPVNKKIAGDALVVRHGITGNLFPAIYVGGGNAITAFEKTGITVFRLDDMNVPIKARRL
jgi:hypothetical protein